MERCNLRGDIQEVHLDYDLEGLYAPVAAYESFSLLLLAVGDFYNLEMGLPSTDYNKLPLPPTRRRRIQFVSLRRQRQHNIDKTTNRLINDYG